MAEATPPVRDAGPLQSKKFLAFFIAEITWKVIIGMGLWLLKEQIDAASAWMWWWMITATIITGFLEVGAILGIAYVDKYVRVAQITTNGKSPTGGKPPASDTPNPGD